MPGVKLSTEHLESHLMSKAGLRMSIRLKRYTSQSLLMNESKMLRLVVDTQSLLQTRIRSLVVETPTRDNLALVKQIETELSSQVRSKVASQTCIFIKSLVANITLYS